MKFTKIVFNDAGRRVLPVLITTLFLAGLCFGQPAVTLSAKTGPPTTNIFVSGSGFAAYAAIDIYFDTTDEALASANGSGAFSKIEIQVPSSALPGTHWVTAVQRLNDNSAQAPFKVNTNWVEEGFTPKGDRSNPYENVLNNSTVSAIDLQWSYPTGGPVYSSPAVANGVVYVGSDDNNVYALNAKTGARLWSFATGGSVVSSPAVANGVVYVGSDDDNVYALNASTGAELWSFTTGNQVQSSPAVANGVVYVGSTDAHLYALNALTGEQLWMSETGSIYSSPAVSNGVVYIAIQFSFLEYYFFVYALNASTGAGLWVFQAPGYDVQYSSPAVSDGVVYIGSDNYSVYALNALTGAELWSYATGNQVQSSPAVANGVVYIGSDDDNVYALSAATGALLWYITTGNSVISSPAVANGVVYVGSNDNNVYGLEAYGGGLRWRYTTGNAVNSSPTVVNGAVYVGSLDNNVYAFGLPSSEEAAQAPQRPDPSTLQPNLNLKPSQPATIVPGNENS